MKMKKSISLVCLFVFTQLLCVFVVADEINTSDIRITYDKDGVWGISSPKDPYGAIVTSLQSPLRLTVSYQVGQGDWQNLNLRQLHFEESPKDNQVKYTTSDTNSPLRAVQTFKVKGGILDWDIDIETTTNKAVRIGDLAISVPEAGPRGSENPKQIFEHGFMAHQFIEGSGSFIYFVRASGAPPFLIVTVKPGTHLEYFGGRGGFYVHSGLSGGNEKRVPGGRSILS